ncbi:MAG: isoprenylcysteine carboxylmethyltransferase family protein [Candidatus Micrarchaeia archaeon]
MDIIGRAPINEIVFITGKSSMYLAWLGAIAQAMGFNVRVAGMPDYLSYSCLAFAAFGALVSLAGLMHLGASVSLGLPRENTEFKDRGIYRLSRNPIYLGFNIMTIAAVAYAMNPAVALLGIYGMLVQHRIILSEEKFLKKRFGIKYSAYCKKVRRYF